MFPINILVFNIIPWKCQHLTFSFICNSSCHSWRHQYQPCCLNHPRAQPLKSLDASPTMLFSCTPHFSRHITPFSFSSNNHTTFETSTTTAYPSSVLMIDTHIFITMHYIITYTLILLFFSLINTSNPVTLHFFFFFCTSHHFSCWYPVESSWFIITIIHLLPTQLSSTFPLSCSSE